MIIEENRTKVIKMIRLMKVKIFHLMILEIAKLLK